MKDEKIKEQPAENETEIIKEETDSGIKKEDKKTDKKQKMSNFLSPIQKIDLPLHPLRRPDGGIGRRVGLKHQWGNTRAGSTPALGTANTL